MERTERNRIRQMVLSCRRVLEEEYDALLRLHGLLPDKKLPAPAGREETRRLLDNALGREGQEYAVARPRYVRQAAFSFLNRLVALRVAEAQGLIGETVLPRPEYGNRSRRERDLADADPHLAADAEELAHTALREALSELAAHIPLLFREGDPYAILWPRLPAYRAVRQAFVQLPPELWREFETLGWVYQYFHSVERDEIRRRLRRNPQPDEIPPLNQFYTVGWIVRALVENTLGHLWLETHPHSPLRQRWQYLVPLQNQFRSPAEERDVARWRVLDPACGSGHFLLGAFDLLLPMWQEAHPEMPAWQIPASILEHNLYGVDIDLRACQIAAAALYLKARTAFERLKGSDPRARFAPRRLNIVCADIRFSDGERRQRFLSEFEHDQPLLRLVQDILATCEQAYELGSLLDIRAQFERSFHQRVRKPSDWQPQAVQLGFLQPDSLQLALGDVPVPVPREYTVEEMVEKVREFIRAAARRQDMGSQLFGLDAEQAVHLVDVLTQSYDVVLMNPPYGALSPGAKEYARKVYPRTHNDAYAAFIELAIRLCRAGGRVGALTGRTFLFLKSFQKLREEILRSEALPEIVWDLGFNVLDEATARYAAFTLRKRYEGDGVSWREHPVTFFRLTEPAWDEKRVCFEEALAAWSTEESCG
ncbi:MAG: hypothetical protein H5T68_12310 [Chloroflexi bacterium]|nr:hypothetical protein [Chloroflexota bacterium]